MKMSSIDWSSLPSNYDGRRRAMRHAVRTHDLLVGALKAVTDSAATLEQHRHHVEAARELLAAEEGAE